MIQNNIKNQNVSRFCEHNKSKTIYYLKQNLKVVHILQVVPNKFWDWSKGWVSVRSVQINVKIDIFRSFLTGYGSFTNNCDIEKYSFLYVKYSTPYDKRDEL